MRTISEMFRPAFSTGGKSPPLTGVFFLFVSAALFLGAVATLLWKTYDANEKHEYLAKEQFLWDTRNLASNLDYFFQERHSDLHNLAESRQIETYFENLALGMSPRYGLLASVQEIEAVFHRILADKMLGGAPIFESFSLQDADGETIARLQQQARASGAETDAPAGRPPQAMLHENTWRIVGQSEGHPALMMTHPVVVQGKAKGVVRARISLETVFFALLKDAGTAKQRTYCLSFNDQGLPYPAESCRDVADALRDSVDIVSRLSAVPHPGGSFAPGDGYLLGTAAQVGKTPFKVLNTVEERALLGPTNWPFAALSGFFSIVLLFGLALLGRINADRLVLNVRLEEQHRSGQALRKRMEEFNSLFSALPGYAFYKDPAGVYVTANAAFCEAVGLPLQAVVGKRDDQLFPEYLASGYMRDDRLILSGAIDFFETEETILHNGRELRLLTRKIALRHSDGTLGGLIGLGFDLTEKKRIEEELRLANERMEERIRQRTEELANANDRLQGEVSERMKAHQAISLILNAISAILIVVDGQGRVQRWSKTARNAFDMEFDAVVGRPFLGLPLPWDWEAIAKGVASCQESRSAVKLSNIWYERPDGTDGYLVVTVSPLDTADSGSSDYLLLGDDITDIRHLEAQLSQAAKLEAIGQLAAGIAHEINTPTQYVGDSVSFLKDAFLDLEQLLTMARTIAGSPTACGPDTALAAGQLLETIGADFLLEEVPRTFTRIFEGIDRISTIVMAMKRFSYSSGEEKKAVNIGNAITNTLIISRNEWKYIADSVTDFDPELTDVMCHAAEINQVFLNIIVNAAHAIKDVTQHDGGMGLISISTRKDGDFAEIRISDTGTGIPKEIGDKVFNLFFTTKEVGKGTGQGLAIAYDIVANKHNGTITYESEPGKGTTFIIRLPIMG